MSPTNPHKKPILQRISILPGSPLLILLLLVIAVYNLYLPDAKPQTQKDVATTQKVDRVDPRVAQLYEWQKNRLETAVQAYFDKAISSGQIVGVGVSITSGDSILLTSGYGKKDITSGNKVDGETVFRLGSLSKGFTGILAAALEEEGKLNWDDKVRDYLPQFRFGDELNTDKITLAHILSHTSGTPYHSYTNLVEAGLPLSDIAGRFGEVAPISKPGEMYSYQNAMFALSSEMMARATGQDITKSLEQRFFKPLGMHTATAAPQTLASAENVAMPHIRYRRGYRKIRLSDSYHNAVAAGGINASALDMAKWMRFLMGGNPEVLQPKALQDAFTPFIEIKGHAKYYHRWPGHIASYYGFGWRIHKFEESAGPEEKTIWHHGGSVNNYRNEIALYPEDKLGICVLLNSNSRISRTVIPDLYEIVKEVYQQPPPTLAVNSWEETLSPL